MATDIFHRPRPKTLGGMIDRLYAMRAVRLKAGKAIDAMKAQELILTNTILSEFPKSRLQMARGKHATAARKVAAVADVHDWPKLYGWIKKHDAFDLLARSPNNAAFRDRWDEGEKIDGVGFFDKITLSLTKR